MFPLEQAPLEFLLIGAIALVVIGPKDLPVALRKFGQFMAKLRGMAAEFRASLDELARQSELEELRKEVEALRHGNYGASAPAPDPAYDYKPYDDASAGLDSSGLAALPETIPSEPAIMGEGLPPAAVEYPVAQRPRRARGPRPDAAPVEGAAEAVAAAEPAKPARKPRAKKVAAPAADASTPDAAAPDAAE